MHIYIFFNEIGISTQLDLAALTDIPNSCPKFANSSELLKELCNLCLCCSIKHNCYMKLYIS